MRVRGGGTTDFYAEDKKNISLSQRGGATVNLFRLGRPLLARYHHSSCPLHQQMFLTVYLGGSDQHISEVPVTPETLCRDVVELCKEPGEADCYLAELWRGSGLFHRGACCHQLSLSVPCDLSLLHISLSRARGWRWRAHV